MKENDTYPLSLQGFTVVVSDNHMLEPPFISES